MLRTARAAAWQAHVWVPVAGTRMPGAVAGHASPGGSCPRDVVLVPGWGCSFRYFARLAAALAPIRVVALDLPGAGWTPRRGHAPTVRQLSSAVADWLVATGRQRSVVVGHSVGCHVVADLASHAGHLAGPIVLAAPVVDARRRPWPHHLVPLAHDVIRGGPRWWGLWSMLALDLLASGGVWSLRHYDHLVEHPLATTARRLPGTTVVIRGAGDPLSPPDLVRDVAAAAPGGRLVEVPGARHLVHWTHAAEVARAISPLLRR